MLASAVRILPGYHLPCNLGGARRNSLNKGLHPGTGSNGLRLQQSIFHKVEALSCLVDTVVERVVINSLSHRSIHVSGCYGTRIYIYDPNDDIQGSDGHLERSSPEEFLCYLQGLLDAVPSHEEFLSFVVDTSGGALLVGRDTGAVRLER